MAQQMTLQDGRRLDYAVTGAKNGVPLVWFHGTPSGYNPIPFLESVCQAKGISLITFSRAGFGDSTRQTGRTVLDVVDDTAALLEHLGHKECLVGGWSGGGPHALACAARLPGCVAAVAVASVAPYGMKDLDFFKDLGGDNVQEFNAALKGEAELQKFCHPVREEMLKPDSQQNVEALTAPFPDVDKKLLFDNPELLTYVREAFSEGVKHSCDGWVDDDLAFIKPWGFDVSEVQCPVFLYHGTEDIMVPFIQGQWLANHIPSHNLTKHLQNGDGHISIMLTPVQQIVDELLGVHKAR